VHKNQEIGKLLFGAVCISFAPVFVKMLGINLMSPTSIGFWRTFLGAIMLFSLTLLRGNSPLIDKSLIKWTALAGFMFSVDLFFWHRSIVYSGAAIATILASTQVFGTSILSHFIFNTKLTVNFFAAAIAAFVGVALLIGVGSEIEFSSRYLRGVVYGLITGVAYAHYLVTVKFAAHQQELPDSVVLMAWISLFVALFLGSASIIENSVFLPPDLYSFFILVLLGLVPQTLGWWSISSGLARVEASQAGLILLLQPVLATVWGLLFFSEKLTLMQLIGGVLTLLTVYVGGMTKNKTVEQITV